MYGVAVSLVGFVLQLAIVSDSAGFWGVVAGMTVFPLTFAAAPLYSGFSLHDWMPALLCYGGLITMGLGYSFGSLVSSGDQRGVSR